MGVVYFKEVQNYLEVVYDYLYIVKEIVYVKLFLEFEKIYGNKVIIVLIKYNDDWCKFGYIIVVELIKYLYVVWFDGLDFEVIVKYIKFRFCYLKVGFCIIINLIGKENGSLK